MTVCYSLHFLLDYECLPFAVTDLVLIYESVTSSASVVRWLALHRWTLNFWTHEWNVELPYEWTLFCNSRWAEERSLPPTVHLLLRLFFAAGSCLPNRCPAMVIFVTILWTTLLSMSYIIDVMQSRVIIATNCRALTLYINVNFSMSRASEQSFVSVYRAHTVSTVEPHYNGHRL
jgi:hypothetical protein